MSKSDPRPTNNVIPQVSQNGAEKTQLNLYMPVTLFERLKAVCVRRGNKPTRFVVDLIKEHLPKFEAK